MSYSVAQIRAWHPSAMSGGASEASSATQGLDNAVKLLQQGKQNLLSEWRSRSAAPAAEAKYSQKIADADNVGQVLAAMVREIKTGGEALTHAREQVLQTVEKARAAGFNVNEQTGKVTPKHIAQASGPGFTAMQAAQHNVDQEVAAIGWQKAIQAACAKFESVDDQVAGALGESPDVHSAQAKAIIAEVDAGIISNPTAALGIPWTAYSKQGREKILSWVLGHRREVGSILAAGNKVYLPPSPNPYALQVPSVQMETSTGTPWLKLTYTIGIPAAAGVAALTINRSGGHPSVSGDLENSNGGVSGAVSDEGVTGELTAQMDDPSGATSAGIECHKDGPWLDLRRTSPDHPKPGQATVTADLQYRPEIYKRLDPQPNPVERFVISVTEHTVKNVEGFKHSFETFWKQYVTQTEPLRPQPVPHAPDVPEPGIPKLPSFPDFVPEVPIA